MRPSTAISLRAGSGARCNSISATSSVMPRSRTKRDCSASSGSRTEDAAWEMAVSYTHLRAHETSAHL
eukprot:9974888-Alexandrium_andersonii.AAC.1